MPIIDIPPEGPYTKVGYIYLTIDRIANYVAGWCNDINGVWMIGKYLFDFGKYVERRIRDISLDLRGVDRGFYKAKQGVKDLFEGTAFGDLLDELSSNYRKIRNDPVGWVRGRFRDIGYQFGLFLDDPYGWVRTNVREVTGWFGWFLDSPRGFIIGQIKSYSNWFSSFLINPTERVRKWVVVNYPFLADLWSNPSGVVVGWLTSWYPWLWGFLQTPLDWLDTQLFYLSFELWHLIHFPQAHMEEILMNLLGINVYDMHNLWEWVLRKTLSNLTARRVQFESQIGRTAGEVISWFL